MSLFSHVHNVFDTIGRFILLTEGYHNEHFRDILGSFDGFTLGLVFTIVASLFGLVVLRCIVAVPNFFSLIAESRRIKFVEIEKELLHKRHEFDYLNQELGNLTLKISELEKINLSSDQHLEEALTEVSRLETECQYLQEQECLRLQQVEDLRLTLGENKSHFDSLSFDKQEQTREIKKLSLQLENKNQEILSLEQKVESFNKLEETCATQSTLLEQVFAEFLLKSGEGDAESFKKVIHELQSPNELLSNYLSALKRLNQSNQARIELESQISQTEKKMTELREEYNTLQREKTQVESKLTFTSELLTSTMNQIYDEKAEILLLTRERNQREDEMAQLRRTVSTHAAHLRDYDELIASVRHARDVLEGKYRSAQLEVGRQQQTISALKNEVASLESRVARELSINEANRPFTRPVEDMHPCLLSLLNNSKGMENVAQPSRDDLPNISDYKLPLVDGTSLVSDLKSDFSGISPAPVSLVQPPLMSTIVHEISHLSENHQVLSNVSTIGSDPSNSEQSVRTNGVAVQGGDSGMADPPNLYAAPDSFITSRLPHFAAPDNFFMPGLQGECQFGDPFEVAVAESEAERPEIDPAGEELRNGS